MLSIAFWQKLLGADLPAAKSRAILERLGSFSGDPLDFLEGPAGLTEIEKRRWEYLREPAIETAQRNGVRLMLEKDYPELLRESPGVQPALFIWGDEEVLRQPTIAIVGTRSASAYGRACAMKFAQAFAEAGITVVSGGALGIDAAAHKGALQAGGKTVAVLAGGVDWVYPAVHDVLFREIRESGCLVSEFAVGTKPVDYKFLQRNALIAAASLGVLVIEAPARSGALSTATAAAELGRDVFVIPASIDMLSYTGSFNLIRDGAALVTRPMQVLEALNLEPALISPVHAPASESGSKILAVLTSTPLAAEHIVERSGLDTAEVLSELTMLELEGRVIRDATGYAIRP